MSFSKSKVRLITSTLLVAALVFATIPTSIEVQALEETSGSGETQAVLLRSANNMVPDMMSRGDQINVSIPADQFSTKPLTTFEVYIHSTLLQLGDTFTSDKDGNLSFSVQLPAGISPGYHTLHIIYGPDTEGTQLDIRDVVFVVASTDDYDGDGILNEQDSCTIMPQSEPEFDEDSIDPVCGGQNETSTNNASSQSGGSKLPTSQVLGSSFLNPLLSMYKKSLKNTALAQDSAVANSAIADPQTGPEGDVLGTARDDVVIIKKAAEEPPKKTYEMSLIVGLTAAVFLLVAGVAASKWYAKHSD